jgi:hypothetical protein
MTEKVLSSYYTLLAAVIAGALWVNLAAWPPSVVPSWLTISVGLIAFLGIAAAKAASKGPAPPRKSPSPLDRHLSTTSLLLLPVPWGLWLVRDWLEPFYGVLLVCQFLLFITVRFWLTVRRRRRVAAPKPSTNHPA